jgi:hypothetical protein
MVVATLELILFAWLCFTLLYVIHFYFDWTLRKWAGKDLWDR